MIAPCFDVNAVTKTQESALNFDLQVEVFTGICPQDSGDFTLGTISGLPSGRIRRFAGSAFLRIPPTVEVFVIKLAFLAVWCSHRYP